MSNNYRKKLSFPNPKKGIEKRQQWTDEIAGYTGYLPENIDSEDIDNAFFELVKRDISPVVEMLRDGSVVRDNIPTIFMTTQAWVDYSKTWEHKESNKDLTYPFIIITRETDLKPGTIQNGYYNIPGRRNWTYLKVPNTENGRDGIDLYKIPQPTAVDIAYQVKIFSSRVEHINKFNESIYKNYNSLQKYVIVKGHPMPTKNEGSNDESELEISDSVVLINSFEILLQGYLIDSSDFEHIRYIDRTSFSVGINKIKNIRK